MTSQKAAKFHGLSVWWGKCGKGHLTERKVSERSCPICIRISRDVRDKRLKEGLMKLSKAEEIELHEIYQKSRELTKTTGIEHHVDHIRPLAAGGTHHPKNLQIISAKENLQKSSTFKGEKKVYSTEEKRESRQKFEQELKEEKLALLEKKKEIARSEYEKQKRESRNSTFIFLLVGTLICVVLFALS